MLLTLAWPRSGAAQQSVTWDVNGVQAAVGGSGAWDTSSNFWFTGATHQPWNNAAFDRPVFAGSAGTVSVANGINVNRLAFNVGGYTLSGGTLAFGGTSPGITTQVAVTTINSALTGATGFTKDGTATLALGGNNTAYTGVTLVSAGTLRVDNANALGLSAAAANLVLDNGATFSFNTHFSHNYTLTGGVVQVQGGAFTWSGAPTLTAASTLNLNSSVSGGTLSGNLADTGGHVLSLTRDGPGRVVLSGNNSYTGATTIVAGHLQLGSAVALSTGSNLVFNGAAGAGGSLELTAASGNFVRAPGTGANQVQWTGDGGFVSSGVARTVNLGGAGAQLVWAAGAFVPTGSRLILGTASNSTLDFQNAIDLGNGIRAVQGDGGNLTGHARLSGVLSGAGGLAQVGNGILGLTGVNTYSGGTTMRSGTVLVASDTNLGASAGLLNFEGGILQNTGAFSTARGVGLSAAGGTFRTDANLVASGAITGSGRLTKTGAATLTLTGANTYSGDTTVSAGTLQIGNGTNLGSIGGDVINNAVLAFDRLDTVSFAGSISGTGRLEQRGTGTLVLSGAGIHTGGTVIAQGTLQIGNGSGAGSLAGNVVNSGALVFDAVGTTAFAGIVSGSGSLTKSGTGALNLSGVNTHAGGTIISAGTLVMAGAGTLGMAAGATTVGLGILDLGGTAQTQSMLTQTGGAVANGTIGVADYRLVDGRLASTAVVVASSRIELQSGLVDGVLAGSGAVSKTTAGTVVLTGKNTYAGGTTIHAGTLAIGDGARSGSILGDVLNDGVIAFHLPGETVVGASISGTGAVQQRGPGTLHLTGNSASFTGDTSVLNATLAVDGVLGGTMNVLSGGRLQGTGTVGSTQVQAGAVLAPGSPFGTLYVAGNASFAPDSIFETRTDAAGTIALLHVTGTGAVSGGTVRVVTPGSIFRTGARYTILAADAGRTGQFTAVTETLPLLDMTLAYGPNAVYLDVARNSTTVCSLAATQNQCATSSTDASLGSGNAVRDSVVNLPTLAAIQDALDQLSGEVHASANAALGESSRFIRNSVMHGMRVPVDGSAWGTFVDESAHTAGDDNVVATQGRTRGFFVGGLPWTVGPFRVGIAGGHTRDAMDTDARGSSRTGDNYHAALYGTSQAGPLELRLGTALTLHRLQTQRLVRYPGFSDEAEANRKAHTVQVFGEAAYGMNFGSLAVEPFAGLAYVSVTTSGFTERGGASALRASSREQAVTYATLGVNLAQTISVFGGNVRARLKLGWRHAGGALAATAQHAIGNSSSFEVAGLPVARNALLVESGLEFELRKGLTAGVSYTGQFSEGRQNKGLQANMTWRF